MTKYLGFQYSVTCGTAVTRTEVTLCWRNQCETVQLLTLTPDFIAPALWSAKSPNLKPLDYRIWSNLQERVSQPDSWRWPAEVARDQEWEQFQPLFINEAVRQWRPRLLACIRAHGGHFEHRLRMFDICTNVHFDSHMSVWLPIVALMFLGDLTKPAIPIAGVDRFYWNFYILFAVRRCIVATKFCWNPTLFAGVMKMYTVVYFFPDTVYVAYNFSHFSSFLQKFIKIGGNLTKF